MRGALFAETTNVLGHGDGVDAPAVLRIALAEDARLGALADQVVVARDAVLVDEDLGAPFLDVAGDRQLLAIRGALDEARVVLEQRRADDRARARAARRNS
jgi:hypothetical protein